jgi:hypothetical protein
MRVAVIGVGLLCVIAAGCGGSRPEAPVGHREEVWHSPVSQLLLKYVGDDGQLTRAQMEAGLRRDFTAADLNHNGVLEPDEARAVNQQRWDEDRSAISPLQDWNGDGVIDFAEYAAAARTLFRELDLEHTGVLTVNRLRAARGLGPVATPGGQGAESDGTKSGGQHRGGHGGGRPGTPGG